MNKQYLLFDLDGTLTDPQEGITNSVAYALRQYGIIEDPKNLTNFIGPPLHIGMRDFYGFDEEKAFEAVAHYRVYFADKGIFEKHSKLIAQKICQYKSQNQLCGANNAFDKASENAQ